MVSSLCLDRLAKSHRFQYRSHAEDDKGLYHIKSASHMQPLCGQNLHKLLRQLENKMDARVSRKFDALDVKLETLASRLDRLEISQKRPNPQSCQQSEILGQGCDRLEHTPSEEMNPSHWRCSLWLSHVPRRSVLLGSPQICCCK